MKIVSMPLVQKESRGISDYTLYHIILPDKIKTEIVF